MPASLHSRLVGPDDGTPGAGSNASASAGSSSGGAPFGVAPAHDAAPEAAASEAAAVVEPEGAMSSSAAGAVAEGAMPANDGPGRGPDEKAPSPNPSPWSHRRQPQPQQRPVAAAPARGLSPAQRLALTLAMPLMMMYCMAAFAVAWMSTFTVVPSYILAQRLYWTCPFIPHIWRRLGPLAGFAARIGFESSHCINILTRLLTLPLRPHLPSFYILGFPKCGTTSLAEHLRTHPGLSATAGLPYHEALAKESHFFQGVYGRSCASSRLLYRSCFPTVVTRWWHEVVRGAPAWMCFDACPVNACTPHVAERIRRLTPDAKIVVMLRDPVPGVFSAEIMMRDMGVPLEWTLTEPVTPNDPRFTQIPADVASLWRELAVLPHDAPLPYKLPYTLYNTLGATLQCGMYAELLQPFLERFPRESFMFINFGDFVKDTEGVVRQVLDFVGLDSQSYRHVPLLPAMKNNYGSRRMHPSVKAALTELFREPNRRVAALLGRNDLGWAGMGPESA
ncbi:hypothetical protein PLESTB_000074200 [Pleodorina starrii]|uniref:Sulfotransferase n=1 Tax=Pleodorina starrii TaxID=330485 RepID=A0A9W6EXG6_9CHLO|nr:hypothetical protein PLESTB_000074200 [Pleodorina starrii]GLC66530.1 hypothetical protein PLESTF_000440500 [Pleodorina starrii]